MNVSAPRAHESSTRGLRRVPVRALLLSVAVLLFALIAPIPDDPALAALGSAFIVVALGAVWVTELLRRARRDALRGAGDLVLSVNRRGVITWASESCGRVLGTSAESLVGRRVEDVVHPLDAPAARALLSPDTESGLASRRELRVPGERGERTIEFLREARSDSHRARTIELRGRDTTELKLVEQQTRRAAQMEMLGRITSGIAPDFNNIVTTIQGHAAVLAHELRATPQHESIQEIQVAGERLAALIHQLLAYTRMQHLSPVTVDLQTTMAALLPALRGTLGESIHVNVSIDDRTPHVHVDAGELRNALLILANRARSVMPDGGRLAIELAPTELTPDRSRTFPYPVQAGQYAMLSIADAGSRPDSDTLAHIFQPFTDERTTGLELASVYGFVKQSGGYIWADPGEQAGTLFTIYLPVAAQDAVELEAARHEPPATRIMVVEDDVAVRSLVRVLLLRRGYSVLEASDGQDAFDVIERLDQPLDLLITDIMMPRMRGDALAKLMRTRQPDVRVLMMSGYAADPDVAGDLAPAPFLHKPFSPDELLRAVHSTLVSGSERFTIN